ncbi:MULTISPECIES: murein hydrolase activator EnvC family protein [Streptomyces]|uniref:M23-family peptidase n=1 Tax=Streptomyces griseus subsp. griseus (strain JCM 4626 / CBS 651.72 / NBRC 13350 / KCC S-0626 / ISP 5235) TaxID=455632 RepID=B1VYT8_STRGG|nr:M23 family metallopeptidase [Streptomyces griseus]BAG18693.1 putative M23-family peptidase [Streptomyces griseus subsp. griseus NBRC 13350]SED42099.1 Peptidase family M23 [Streptomyces griseus]SQA21227.1 M23 family peptidase [Streptomyces griseus]
MRLQPGPRRPSARRRPPQLPLVFPVLLVLVVYVLIPVGPSAPGGSSLAPAGALASAPAADAEPTPRAGAAGDGGTADDRDGVTTGDGDGGTTGAGDGDGGTAGHTGADTGTGIDSGARSWPLAGRPAVLRGWEPPAGPYGPGHRGVDLAAGPGARVLAAADGRVSFAGRVAGRGVVAVEVAGSGSPPLRTTYEPVRALVEEGVSVRAGQPVGVLEDGPFHCDEGCLHWGLRRGDAYLDPLSLLPPALLRKGPSRLLPVFGVPEPVAVRVSRAHRAGPSRRRCPR